MFRFVIALFIVPLLLGCSVQGAPASTPAPTPVPTATPAPTTGRWVIAAEKDPLDDSVMTSATLIAHEGKGRFGSDVSLGIVCSKDTSGPNFMFWLITWDWYFSDDSTTLQLRWDDAPAYSYSWRVSSDTNTGLIGNGPSEAFAKKAMAAKQLIVRATPYKEPPVTAIFDLDGSHAAIQEILDDCSF